MERGYATPKFSYERYATQEQAGIVGRTLHHSVNHTIHSGGAMMKALQYNKQHTGQPGHQKSREIKLIHFNSIKSPSTPTPPPPREYSHIIHQLQSLKIHKHLTLPPQETHTQPRTYYDIYILDKEQTMNKHKFSLINNNLTARSPRIRRAS